MDTCPKCGSTLRIKNNYLTFKHDDTPRKPTEAYWNHEMMCVNPSCHKYNQVVGTDTIPAN